MVCVIWWKKPIRWLECPKTKMVKQLWPQGISCWSDIFWHLGACWSIFIWMITLSGDTRLRNLTGFCNPQTIENSFNPSLIVNTCALFVSSTLFASRNARNSLSSTFQIVPLILGALGFPIDDPSTLSFSSHVHGAPNDNYHLMGACSPHQILFLEIYRL